MNQIISALPDAPGCYIFWDSAGDCLYVGKSKRVRSRVRSYFGKSTSPKVQKLAKLIVRIEYRPTIDEIGALFLEHGLIKTYRPPFNSQMKKDRHSHYICIEWEHAKPGLYISDRPGARAMRYGNFNSVYDAKEALTLLNRTWFTPICEIKYFDTQKPARGCLNLHIGRCLGPCRPGNPPGYREQLLKAAAFMQGRNKQVLATLKRDMTQASAGLDFEKAARIRDVLEDMQMLQRRFAYHVPFGGRRICVFIKGHHDPEILALYYKNGHLRHAQRLTGLDDWAQKRDDFIAGMTNDEKTADNLTEMARIYTASAIQEIRARKLYVDVTKTSKIRLMQRLDKAMKRFDNF